MSSTTRVVYAFLFGGLLFCSCDLLSSGNDDETTARKLRVKFTNASASTFVITDIQLLAMGAVTQQSSPSGTWSNNILSSGESLTPGKSDTFTLDIPSGEWSQYRLGVLDEAGNHVMLHEQPGYTADQMLGRITHWGSDDRSVSVTVTRDTYSRLIVINGYSDYAGLNN